MFKGKPHFIKVTSESEAKATAEGNLGLLANQYALLGDIENIYPWEAIVINTEDYKTGDGYNTNELLARLLNLKFATIQAKA